MNDYIITCDDETASWVGNDVESMRKIVRCKDCKYYMAYMAGAYCDYMAHAIEPDGFCAWGIKKGDDR